MLSTEMAVKKPANITLTKCLLDIASIWFSFHMECINTPLMDSGPSIDERDDLIADKYPWLPAKISNRVSVSTWDLIFTSALPPEIAVSYEDCCKHLKRICDTPFENLPLHVHIEDPLLKMIVAFRLETGY